MSDNVNSIEPMVAHPKTWWWVKVICGLVLIGGVAARFVFDVAPNLAVLSVPAAQIMVMVGGALYIWHYWIVSRNNKDMQTPSTLVRRGGLFPLIRHPMYFADLIYYTGLALLWSTHLALMVLLIAWLALLMQSRVEDQWCANRFVQQHADWRQSSKLLIPFIY